MKLLQTMLIVTLWTIFLLSDAHATSFIADCANESWRYEQADIVIEGTVLSTEPYDAGEETHTKTVFKVDDALQGNVAVGDEITVTHIGNAESGMVAIALTIDYKPGERYRLELLQNEEDPTTYSAVCGEMSVMKLEDAPEEYVIQEEQELSLWQRIVSFFRNLLN